MSLCKVLLNIGSSVLFQFNITERSSRPCWTFEEISKSIKGLHLFLYDFNWGGQRFLENIYFEFVTHQILRFKMKPSVIVETESKDSSQKNLNIELYASLVVIALVWEKGRGLLMRMGMQCPLVPLNEDEENQEFPL